MPLEGSLGSTCASQPCHLGGDWTSLSTHRLSDSSGATWCAKRKQKFKKNVLTTHRVVKPPFVAWKLRTEPFPSLESPEMKTLGQKTEDSPIQDCARLEFWEKAAGRRRHDLHFLNQLSFKPTFSLPLSLSSRGSLVLFCFGDWHILFYARKPYVYVYTYINMCVCVYIYAIIWVWVKITIIPKFDFSSCLGWREILQNIFSES